MFIYCTSSKFEKIEESVNIIFEFKEFCEEEFFSLWDIYIMQENKRIYPYQNNTMSKEDSINYVKEIYNQYFWGSTYRADN